MRSIKFRAWNKNEHYMVDSETMLNPAFNNDGHDFFFRCIHGKQFVPMQFIGLTDVNGTEIYEEDLIEDITSKEICKVIYNQDECLFMLEGKGVITRDVIETFELTVVGNSFENPILAE